MKNQSIVGDTDENNSEMNMDDAVINTYLDQDNKCDNDAKDTQSDPNKQNNNDGFEDILNTKKMIPLRPMTKQRQMIQDNMI